MKKKTFTLLRATTLIVATCFLMGMHATAQSFQIASTIVDVVLDPADLSGFYVIQVPTGEYLTTDANVESVSASSNLDVKYVIELAKTETGTYYIKAGDKKANYNMNGWNIIFDNTTTQNIEWIINVIDANAGTVNIQKNPTSYTKCEQAHGRARIYSNGDLANAATFTLKKATAFVTINTPVAATFTSTAETLTTGTDLTGKYLIQNATGGYMTPIMAADLFDLTLLASVDANYAFDLTKQTDETYTISCGGFQAVYLHNWLMSADYLPVSLNNWVITVVDGNMVTIQRASDNSYLKLELNNGAFRYYTNATFADPVVLTEDAKFSLLKVTDISAVAQVSDQIKSKVFESAEQLIVSNTSNVKTIDIYNINGQKVYGANVNSNELSIPVKNWSNGVYLVRLIDGNGGFKSIKIMVN